MEPNLFGETQSQSRHHQASVHINSAKMSSHHALTRQTSAAPIAVHYLALPETTSPLSGRRHHPLASPEPRRVPGRG